ncbi:DUF3461 family protein [Granulosicoccus antarcticus]|uniref:Uncharacterized protein n=1 Tax=Granulosicoccus antarcticus IMCC3135 TaxID=1192854 RepID=A0A2Z2P324_9GAMM|nr:DUF3461 family protein [Granulosicoccus antarcticus]ASJ74144.1 hypothetical protein IMCC3135_20330 [Granulosicoccus antarcticus IMCC3135]
MAGNPTDTDKQYPSLTEMGIVRFNEISHYSLRQSGPDKDVLRIIYNRAKGSFLPHTRKYKFGRAPKTVVADGGTARMEHTYEISPFLLKAVHELDELVKINQHDSSASSHEDLQTDLMNEMNELKQLINESTSSDNKAAVLAKIDSVSKHIEAL